MTIAITPIPAQITYVAPALTLTTANAVGSAASAIRSDADVLVFDAVAPVTQVFGDAATVGVAAVAARRDHTHAMPGISATSPMVFCRITAAGALVAGDLFVDSINDVGVGDRDIIFDAVLGSANYVAFSTPMVADVQLVRNQDPTTAQVSLTITEPASPYANKDVPTSTVIFGAQT